MENEYTTPKLCIPKKGDDWYVYYSIRNPETGRLEMAPKERRGLNRIKDKRKRRKEFMLLCKSLEQDLASGWRPKDETTHRDLNKDNFLWWFQQRLEYAKAKQSYYNWRKLNTVYNHLKSYKSKIAISDVDRQFLRGFELYLTEQGMKPNGIADAFTRVRIIVNELKKEGEIPYNKDPFLTYKVKTTKINRKALTIEQIEKLESVHLDHPLESLARDMYIFSFYCGGIRFGDLCRLKTDMVNKGYLDYTMHKTTVDRHILLMDQAKKILKRHGKGEYIFDTGVDWEKEEVSIDARGSLLRKYLANACEKAEVPKIAFHTSRHSFADYATEHDLPDKTLMQLLGHKKIQTTERYRKSFSKEKTEEAMNKLFKKKI